MKNARTSFSTGFILSRGCWFSSKKLRFGKNFDANFNTVQIVSFFLFLCLFLFVCLFLKNPKILALPPALASK